MTGLKWKCGLAFHPSLGWDKAWAQGGSLCLSLLGASRMSQSGCAPEQPLLVLRQSGDLPYGI